MEPKVDIERWLMEHGSKRGKSNMVQFIMEQGTLRGLVMTRCSSLAGDAGGACPPAAAQAEQPATVQAASQVGAPIHHGLVR